MSEEREEASEWTRPKGIILTDRFAVFNPSVAHSRGDLHGSRTSERIYLNNASVGPLPERTRLVLDAFNRKRAAPFQLPDRELFAIMTESRRLAAELIGAHPEEIALTVNTGFGLSLAARALPLRPGDIVLASDREFPANVYPWMRLKDIGVSLELTPTTAEGWPDEARLLERLADPRVRVLAVSLAQFSNGYTGGPRATIGRDQGLRDLPGRGCDTGGGAGSARPVQDTSGCPGLRGAEVAPVSVGLRVRLRAP